MAEPDERSTAIAVYRRPVAAVRRVRSGPVRLVVAGLGAFLLAAGLLLRFYAAPRLVAAPAGFNATITLSDPHAEYFDQSALKLVKNQPLSYVDVIRGDASAATNSTAVWDEYAVLADIPHKVQVIDTFHRAVFNRRTGELSSCCGASVNDDTAVRQDGTFSLFWPIGTQKTTYDVYDLNTEKAWPAVYSGTAVVHGILTYVFTQHIPVTTVQQIPNIPTSLLGIRGPSSSVVAHRTFSSVNTFWVDPRTGVPVNVEEKIDSVLRGPHDKGSLTAAKADLKMSSSSQAFLAGVANHNASQITLLRTTAPLTGIVLGAVLLLAGLTPVGGRRALAGLWARGKAGPAGPGK